VPFKVNRRDHADTRLIQEDVEALQPGQLRLQVESFALTANTVTYATVGDKFGYWDFYPSREPLQWGRVPAIGWARVVESTVDSVSEGGRYFGWFPMSEFVTMSAVTRRSGFRDVGPHRAKHAPVYVDFMRTDLDPYHVDSSRDGEDRQILLRGLFLTSFLADEYLADLQYYDAKTIVIVSASSKTALGLAQRLVSKKQDFDISIVGVTSARSIPFVSSTNLYDRVVSYQDIDLIPSSEKSVVVDMSGNRAIIAAIHRRLGESLQHSMAVGFSHHESMKSARNEVCGPEPKLFFAPTEVVRRSEEWGPEGYHRKATDALLSFVDSSRRWMDIKRVAGPTAVQIAWEAVQDGSAPAQCGIVASMLHPP
ncbi:unnamed protein product, partial [Ectocarpus fasciculatus]